MTQQNYAIRLRALHQELGELQDLAVTEKDLQLLQAVLTNWHSNALAKEISLAIGRTAREVRDRAVLTPTSLEVLG